MNKLVEGKANIKGIVGLEINENKAILFVQDQNGNISTITKPHRFWILSHVPLTNNPPKLSGNLHYSYGYQFENRKAWSAQRAKWKDQDIYSIWNEQEACQVKDGYCYYQGLQQKDISLLSFDLETTGLDGNAPDAKILLISTTYRDQHGSVNKLFSYDDYENEREMIDDFCTYVCAKNPSLLVGHNVISYDFVYLDARARANNTELLLGRDGSAARLSNYESNFRLDGNRDLNYRKVKVYGREIIDTFFLAISFDVAKKYESYALKPLIKQLGFEKLGRQFYDAGLIRKNYTNPDEWVKIKQYAIDDAEDAVKIWDFMGGPYFYSANNIPKPFGEIVVSATGSKINSMMVRAYLQDMHSLPKASPIDDVKVEGGISFGVPGIYKSVLKIDLKSAYPSQILRFKIYDKEKDPNAYFYEIVKYFTERRFEYKKKAKETGLKYWKDLDDTSKIFINSAYGALNTRGLLFNSPHNAAKITKETRNVIDLALKWASGKGSDYWVKEYGNKEFESDL